MTTALTQRFFENMTQGAPGSARFSGAGGGGGSASRNGLDTVTPAISRLARIRNRRIRAYARHCEGAPFEPWVSGYDDAYSIAQFGPSTREVVRCGCGRGYTREAFRRLEWCGVQLFDGIWPGIVLRHCTCGSTISVEFNR